MESENGGSIYISTEAMIANRVHPIALAAAMDILYLIWWPTKEPFDFNAKNIADIINKAHSNNEFNEKLIKKHKKQIQSFYTVLPDGRWAPSPVYFSMTNGNPGSAS